MSNMFKHILRVISAAILLFTYAEARSFCGFYVAKADAKLFNNRSEVILIRDGNRNVITMSSDFKGDLKDFAMVVPVPTVLKESDIKVIERNIFDVLNEYSAPRLVEYHDSNPCGYDRVVTCSANFMMDSNDSFSLEELSVKKTEKHGVKIEAQYSVEEYDILILSAKESDGLKIWLNENGYKIPETASDVLDPYIKSNMKFFVVKVNLNKMKNRKDEYLRPIQISFDHAKFMLPIRLGMANSQGSQDMIVYAFTRSGRIECTNYRTVKLPTDRNIPLYIQPKFGEFYKSLFDREYNHEGRNAVFLEYAWNLSPYNYMHCDPCVGPPPVNQDFVNAGIWWLNEPNQSQQTIFFTRLHVRYTRDKFPADLQFQVTPNSENFQCRYILTHPATGEFTCEAGQEYLVDLYNRRKREIDEVTALTGWSRSGSATYQNEYNQFIDKSTKDKNEKEEGPHGWLEDFKNNPSKWLLVAAVLLVVVFGMRFRTPSPAGMMVKHH